jgi:2-polyprenyl-3-methyl-5-hydroxy-6-metoxy-1,4-benzoquinol methylase
MRNVNHKYDAKASIAHKYNASIVESYVKTKGHILDVGCWTGQLYSVLSSSGYKYTGIDVSSDAIDTAKKRYKKANWDIANASNLPFKSSQFDSVVIFEVFEHVDNEKETIKEISRVLKKNGVLILSTPAYNFLSILSDPAYFLMGHRHYEEKRLRQILKKDFRIEKIWKKGGPIYVSMYLTQMVFKHILKGSIPNFVQNIWNRVSLYEFNNKEGFLGYYLVAYKK